MAALNSFVRGVGRVQMLILSESRAQERPEFVHISRARQLASAHHRDIVFSRAIDLGPPQRSVPSGRTRAPRLAATYLYEIDTLLTRQEHWGHGNAWLGPYTGQQRGSSLV
ncbi:hypothetical protein VPNG_05256 [Cytospora leucostoma]|uniref:Uncharacterized protein n=1 Tax=Cytospora leucostoma TaxID=1230097 RepID=A0A423X7N8_9PEZI|nr:hypothetical protein VPNG_05256 [Cytospora leucostoma]